MLATGGSCIKAIEVLIDEAHVREDNIVFLNIISCPEGIDALTKRYYICCCNASVCIVVSCIRTNKGECVRWDSARGRK